MSTGQTDGRPPGNLMDKEVAELRRLFGYVPEPEPFDQLLAAVEAIVATHKAVAHTEGYRERLMVEPARIELTGEHAENLGYLIKRERDRFFALLDALECDFHGGGILCDHQSDAIRTLTKEAGPR